MPLPPPGSSLAACSGLTLAGAGVAVAGADAEEAAGAPAGVLAGALANAVAEDEDACAVWGASLTCPLRSALTLSSSAGVLAWFSLFPSPVLRSSFSTLPMRVTLEGSCEISGLRTCETDGGSSPLMLDAR